MMADVYSFPQFPRKRHPARGVVKASRGTASVECINGGWGLF